MASEYSKIKCYNIEIDLNILKNPISDHERFSNYLRY
jgi:hypothetical protein